MAQNIDILRTWLESFSSETELMVNQTSDTNSSGALQLQDRVAFALWQHANNFTSSRDNDPKDWIRQKVHQATNHLQIIVLHQ